MLRIFSKIVQASSAPRNARDADLLAQRNASDGKWEPTSRIDHRCVGHAWSRRASGRRRAHRLQVNVRCVEGGWPGTDCRRRRDTAAARAGSVAVHPANLSIAPACRKLRYRLTFTPIPCLRELLRQACNFEYRSERPVTVYSGAGTTRFEARVGQGSGRSSRHRSCRTPDAGLGARWQRRSPRLRC